jgi:hypothetical protein
VGSNCPLSAPGKFPADEYTFEGLLADPATEERAVRIELFGEGKGNLRCQEGSGSSFAGWSGEGCSGTGTCVVTIEADTVVTATFNANPPPPPSPPGFSPPKCKKGKVKRKGKCVKKHKKHKKRHKQKH